MNSYCPLPLEHRKEKLIHLHMNPSKTTGICTGILELNLKEVSFTTETRSLVLCIYNKQTNKSYLCVYFKGRQWLYSLKFLLSRKTV